ncbi:MAG: hypothetical protein ACKVU0_05135 [Saprospiraceae bacterium]
MSLTIGFWDGLSTKSRMGGFFIPETCLTLPFQKRICPTDNAAFIAMLFFLPNLAADPARQMEQPLLR